MNDDLALLRRFADEGSEAAFAELVRRYLDLVFAAALRRTGGNAQLSADIAQLVFIALAHHAHKFRPDLVLGAWLHTATRNAALKLMISEQRRHRREAEAVTLHEAVATGGAADWERLRPLLDDAIDGLPAADRAPLVLRFFERRPFADIGAALSISADAARMRTERAIEKLRVALARRGIASTAAALAAVVPAQAAISAPPNLAAMLAANSLAAAGAGSAAGLATFMTAKIVIPAALAALVAFTAGTYVGLRTSPAPPAPTAVATFRLAQTVAGLRRENRRLRATTDALAADLTRARETNAALTARLAATERANAAAMASAGKSPTLGMPRYEVQQAVLNNLRQIAAARDQYTLENGHAPDSVNELVGPSRYIRTVRTVGGEDYSTLPMVNGGVLSVVTPDGIAVTFDPTGQTTTQPEVPPEVARLQELQQQLDPVVNSALAAYRAANHGTMPANEQALLPYFATPQQGADFLEFIAARKAAAKP